MSNDLRGQFIANTFQNLVQMPDVSKQNFYNGIGATISVINKDGIGTIKMFYPPSGNISDYFDNNGDGIGEWEGWGICDGHGPTPNLKGRFIVGYDSGDVDYDSIGHFGGSKDMPSHDHDIGYRVESFDEGHGLNNGIKVSLITRAYPNPNVNITGKTSTKGTGSDNRPPYYVLLYVIRLN